MGLRVACLVVPVLFLGCAVAGCGDSSSFRFGNGSLDVTTTSPPLGTRGQVYTTTLAASGGRPRYAWALRTGALPAGLTLDGATGVISGTPRRRATSAASPCAWSTRTASSPTATS